MQTSNNQINCPKCDHEFDISSTLHEQLETEIRKQVEARFASDEKHLKEQRAELETLHKDLQEKSDSMQKQVEVTVQARMVSEREQITNSEREKAKQDNEASLVLLQKELQEKTEQVQELHKSKAEISRLQREQSNMKAALEAENERKLNELLAAERATIQKTEADKNELKIKEKEQLIDTLNKQLTDAQRKAEQGSMQTQGEVQELAVEEWLQSNFPHDGVEEIKKGVHGGDCIQTINTTQKFNCGSIYYESKRTKAFQPDWIEKFKADILDRNTDIGVLVSQARPTGMDRMGMVDGVWVCNFDEFKGLCLVLRNHIIQLDHARASQENRGDKMSMLYDFLQSNEFRLQVEAIVEGFTQMKSDLEREKRSIKGHWKKREKQIDKVLLNTGNMHQSIRGIAGSSIQPVAALEFAVAD